MTGALWLTALWLTALWLTALWLTALWLRVLCCRDLERQIKEHREQLEELDRNGEVGKHKEVCECP